MLREAGNQHTGSTEALALENGWVCKQLQGSGRGGGGLRGEGYAPVRALSSGPEETHTMGSKPETPCANQVLIGQVPLPHLFLLCQVAPQDAGLYGWRKNGLLFLKVVLRLGCTLIEFQGCPEGIKRKARC